MVFTSGDSATARAQACASRAVRPPTTSTSSRRVAPSPSSTISRANRPQTARRPAAKARSKTVPDPMLVRAAPFASAKTVSFVLMSPSTVMRLNVSSEAWRSSRRSRPDTTTASVVITHSMVAIDGAIIPAPFAIPPIWNVRPWTVTATAASFRTSSVVRIACAAVLCPARRRLRASAGMA